MGAAEAGGGGTEEVVRDSRIRGPHCPCPTRPARPAAALKAYQWRCRCAASLVAPEKRKKIWLVRMIKVVHLKLIMGFTTQMFKNETREP